jgi:hypothetical protein
LISQFISIRRRVMAEESVKYKSQVSYVIVDTGPRLLAVRKPAPLLALPAPRVDPHLKEVERKLGVSKLKFQDAMINQMEILTDQMSLMIRSQQQVLPPSVESGRHASGLWCNRAILVSFVGVDKTVIKEETVIHLHKTKNVKDIYII